ncbi:hypothetical protein SmJEL517_g05203 [Synchytrium microbalum]|uniref:Dipeptidase n=1 Tax=Synchytrium microbalum TaxID=1806994 RepID=A0A507C0H0_9FUNG|nr:uncharacterized protein SmJEL517_g05203 [Synchytrium microbalum]TPX31466.1 hypothetical protein SmJEL517_g05203 [Synchytrium microbalum]
MSSYWKAPVASAIKSFLAVIPTETPAERIRNQLILVAVILLVIIVIFISALRNVYRFLTNDPRKSKGPSFLFGVVVPSVLPVLLYTVLTDSLSYMNDSGKVLPYSYRPSQEALELHNRLPFIADLHADTLLWTHRQSMLNPEVKLGHIDMQRLIDGNVALQVFSSVTLSPAELNMYRNSNATDTIRTLGIVQRWPMKAIFGHSARMERVALFASALDKMQEKSIIDGSHGIFVFVKSRTDFDRLLSLRQQFGSKVVGGLLSIEGSNMCHPIWITAEECANRLWSLGVRMVAMTHFVDNAVGSSATGESDYGLTSYGEDYVKRLLELGMMIDMAHTSVKTIDNVIALYDEHVKTTGRKVLLVVSHTGLKSACFHNRNLEDRHAKALAQRGGIIGVAFFPEAVCGNNLTDIIKSYKVAVDLTSTNNVVLGSDYDGAVSVPFDVSDLAYMTQGLLAEGFSESEIQKIMGETVQTKFMEYLPL